MRLASGPSAPTGGKDLYGRVPPGTLKGANRQLGAFSIRLSVRGLQLSKAFYEALGFEAFAGDESENRSIPRSGNAAIGLFRGMPERDTLTFNPGWDGHARPLDTFTEVREIPHNIEQAGVRIESRADGSTNGPASRGMIDPEARQPDSARSACLRTRL